MKHKYDNIRELGGIEKITPAEVETKSPLLAYQERSERAMELVDDIVLKNYLTKLTDLDVVPCTHSTNENIILFNMKRTNMLQTNLLVLSAQ